MPLLSFFGCLFTAYGPILALFFTGISGSAQLVILALTAAFFWLVSLLFISILWYIITPLQGTHAATLAYATIIQELFRYLYYFLYSKAEKGLFSVSPKPASPLNRTSFAFASGIGYGLVSAATSYITLLANTLEDGVIMSPSCPTLSIAFTSGLVTMLMSLLHVTWMLIAFDGYTSPGIQGKLRILFVFLSHLGASYSTLLNGSSSTKLGCVYSIFILLILLLVNAAIVILSLARRWK